MKNSPQDHFTPATSAPISANYLRHAQRQFWDSDAPRYHQDHAQYVADFYWCPEMLHEKDAQILGNPGNLKGQRILEVGCGSAACSRWLAAQRGVHAFAFDLSYGMLQEFQSLPQQRKPYLFQADALNIPVRTASMDQVFSAFGAFAFLADLDSALQEVRRVLVPGGCFSFSTNHPMRWIFPDDPGPAGLQAEISYFDRTPYTEYVGDELSYAEFHRTLGDWYSALCAQGFRVLQIVEPQWPDSLQTTWGQWSPLRGKIFPGTIIFQTVVADC